MKALHHFSWTFLALWLSCSGCSKLQIAEFPETPPSAADCSKTINRLRIGVTPLLHREDQREYFACDLRSAQILPVFVTVENENASTSYVISKEECSLSSMDLLPYGDPAGFDVGSVSGAEAAVMIGGVLIGLSPFFLPILPLGVAIASGGSKAASDGFEIQHNFQLDALYSATLSPGERAQGFVYFGLPADHDADAENLRIRALDVSSHSWVVFDFPLNLSGVEQ